MWDVFISHASEDKEKIAAPLADELQRRGLRIWYDDVSLELGDSLRQAIDAGLARSRYGVAILSPHFFAKHWPQRELDGLSSREVGGKKVILPVWHGVTHAEVAAYSPSLAGRFAVSTDRGIAHVADVIERVVRRGPVPEPEREPEPRRRSEPTTGIVVGHVDAAIGGEQYKHFGMTVTGSGTCRLRGRVQVLRGGNRDVHVVVLTAEEYELFRVKKPYSEIFRERNTSDCTLDVELPGPGRYELVISNRTSWLTPKHVLVEDVRWECTGGAS